jgi:hypothetical protein
MKCEFWKVCPKYDPESCVCNKDGGSYYNTTRKCGKWRELKEKEEASE